MTNRFYRPLVVTLMVSAMTVPVSVWAAPATQTKAQTKERPAKNHPPKIRGAGNLTVMKAAPEQLDPSAGASKSADIDGDLTSGSEQDTPQSMEEALRFAYDRSTTIRAAREALLATQESLPQAQAGYKPTVTATASATQTHVSGIGSANGSFEKDIGVSASEPLFRGGQTVNGIKGAKNTIMAQRATLIQTEAQVMLNVVTAYMNVLRDQSLLNLAENNRDVIAKQLQATQARFKVGDVTKTDVSQAQARLADAESGRIAALGNLHTSQAVYQQTVGMPAGRLSMPKTDVIIPGSMDECIDMAENYNPAVVSAEFSNDAAKNNVDSLNGQLLPTVSLVGAVSHSMDPSPGTIDHETVSSIGVTASVPLYEAGATRSRIRAAKDTASQTEILVAKARHDAREEAVSAWEALQAARAEIESRKSQVVANMVARDGVHKEAELGTRTILDALNADQELLNSRSALVTARRDEVVARYTLAAALGLMTPDSLGFPEMKRDYNQHINEITGKVFSTDTGFGRNEAEKPAKNPVNR